MTVSALAAAARTASNRSRRRSPFIFPPSAKELLSRRIANSQKPNGFPPRHSFQGRGIVFYSGFGWRQPPGQEFPKSEQRGSQKAASVTSPLRHIPLPHDQELCEIVRLFRGLLPNAMRRQPTAVGTAPQQR